MTEADQPQTHQPNNTYEREQTPEQERERLRNFDMPTKASIGVIGELHEGELVVDIGAGENTGLGDYARDSGADYVAFDVRSEAVAEQLAAGSMAVQVDARKLPAVSEFAEVAHARFVLGHFSQESDREQIVNEAFRTLIPGGKVVLMDYDWTAMGGSQAIDRLKVFALDNITLFDPAYGAYSTQETSDFLIDQASVEEVRITPPKLYDYAPVVSLRGGMLAFMTQQGESEAKLAEVNEIFDAIDAEAAQENPPGFNMPDMVATVVTKPQ